MVQPLVLSRPLGAAFEIAADEIAADMPTTARDLLDRPDASTSANFAAELVKQRTWLRSYARHLSRDQEFVEDLVQETMLRAWCGQERFARGSNLRAWTGTILRNLFLSQLRRRRFLGQYDEIAAERNLSVAEAQTSAVELGELERLLEQLPAAQREAIRLVAIDGLTYEEAARCAGVAPGTMKSRMARARDTLRRLAAAEPDACATPDAGPERGALPSKAAMLSTLKKQDQGTASRRGMWARAKAAGERLWIG